MTDSRASTGPASRASTGRAAIEAATAESQPQSRSDPKKLSFWKRQLKTLKRSPKPIQAASGEASLHAAISPNTSDSPTAAPNANLTSVAVDASPNPTQASPPAQHSTDSTHATDETTHLRVATPDIDGDAFHLPIHQLWDEAWKDFEEREANLAQKYTTRIENSASDAVASHSVLSAISTAHSSVVAMSASAELPRSRRLQILLEKRIKELDDGEWKVKFLGNQFAVKNFVEPVVSLIKLMSEYIGDAAQASPYTSVAWVGVSLMLPLVLNPSKQDVARTKGLEQISFLLRQCTMREDLYRSTYENAAGLEKKKTHMAQHTRWREELKLLYVKILTFQATCVCHVTKDTASRVVLDTTIWTNWDELRTKIESQRENLESIEVQWREFKLQEQWDDEQKKHIEMMATLDPIKIEIRRIKRIIDDAQGRQARKDLLKWISSQDFSGRYNEIHDKREDLTGDWLIKHKVYRDWKTTDSSFLWLFGNAGTGKSYLSSKVIDDLKTACPQGSGKVVAYYHFNFNNQQDQDVKMMLRAMLKQLCAAMPSIPDELTAFGTTLKESGATASCKGLEGAIRTAAGEFDSAYLIIDALDECTMSENKRLDLLNSLVRLQESSPENVHLLATSRKETEIVAALNRLGFASTIGRIDLNHASTRKAVNDDIGNYIEQRFKSFEFDDISNEDKTLAREMLLEKAEGMYVIFSAFRFIFEVIIDNRYQYVALQLVAIREDFSGNIPLLLKSLPIGLNETYCRMLQNINPKYKMQAYRILVWVALSKGWGLTSKQLAEASDIDPDANPPFPPSVRVTQLEKTSMLLKLLPGILNEVSSYADDFGSKVSVIRFSHFSVREFLFSKDCRSQYRIEEENGNILIAESCLYYHQYACGKTNHATQAHDINRFPLWRYAAGFWMDHLNAVDEKRWSSDLEERAKSVLKPNTEEFYKMIHIMGDRSYSPLSSSRERPADLVHPVFYVSASGNCRILSLLIKWADNNQVKQLLNTPSEEEFDRPLQAAVRNKHLQMIHLLLDRGADVNAQGGEYGNALQAAADGGSVEVVTSLLNHGADVNAQGGEYGNALQAGAYSGSIEVVTLLLDRGVDVNAQGGEYGNALQAAASEGSVEVVTSLLNRGADVNAQGGKYGNALQAAAAWASVEVVTLLLDRGADINAQGGRYGNALQAAAAFRGSVEVATLLLDRGADVNAQGGSYGNALQAAAFRGSVEVVTSLLNRGANINVQGGKYGNALQAVALRGSVEVVTLLLDRGADINAQGGEYGNALQAAAIRGSVEVVTSLLDHGADVNAQGGKYGNALQAAVFRGLVEVVTLLLDRGADVNAQGGEYGNALQAIAFEKSIEVATLLVDRGANVNVQGGKYGNALQAAVLRGLVEVVTLLLDRGADVNAQGGEYGNALQAVAFEKSIEVATLLVDRGADVNVQGGKYGNALQAAVFRGLVEVVTLLLDRGADVNAQGGKYGNVKNAAENASRNRDAISKLLVDHGGTVSSMHTRSRK